MTAVHRNMAVEIDEEKATFVHRSCPEPISVRKSEAALRLRAFESPAIGSLLLVESSGTHYKCRLRHYPALKLWWQPEAVPITRIPWKQLPGMLRAGAWMLGVGIITVLLAFGILFFSQERVIPGEQVAAESKAQAEARLEKRGSALLNLVPELLDLLEAHGATINEREDEHRILVTLPPAEKPERMLELEEELDYLDILVKPRPGDDPCTYVLDVEHRSREWYFQEHPDKIIYRSSSWKSVADYAVFVGGALGLMMFFVGAVIYFRALGRYWRDLDPNQL